MSQNNQQQPPLTKTTTATANQPLINREIAVAVVVAVVAVVAVAVAVANHQSTGKLLLLFSMVAAFGC